MVELQTIENNSKINLDLLGIIKAVLNGTNTIQNIDIRGVSKATRN
jgi:hypothetical protein